MKILVIIGLCILGWFLRKREPLINRALYLGAALCAYLTIDATHKTSFTIVASKEGLIAGLKHSSSEDQMILVWFASFVLFVVILFYKAVIHDKKAFPNTIKQNPNLKSLRRINAEAEFNVWTLYPKKNNTNNSLGKKIANHISSNNPNIKVYPSRHNKLHEENDLLFKSKVKNSPQIFHSKNPDGVYIIILDGPSSFSVIGMIAEFPEMASNSLVLIHASHMLSINQAIFYKRSITKLLNENGKVTYFSNHNSAIQEASKFVIGKKRAFIKERISNQELSSHDLIFMTLFILDKASLANSLNFINLEFLEISNSMKKDIKHTWKLLKDRKKIEHTGLKKDCPAPLY